jgi:hypothetical protein
VTGLISGQTELDLQTVLGGAARTTGRQGKIKFYVHVDADDLDADAKGGPAFGTGTIELLGAATMAKLRQWVGHHQVVFQPVRNLHRRDAVDQHDPPEWMRELVILRDGHCIFPAAPSTPAPATSTTRSPTTPTDHPDKPTPTSSPACAGDTTAPRPSDGGDMRARPKATISGTDRTVRRTSSLAAIPPRSDRVPGHERTDADGTRQPVRPALCRRCG